MPLKTLLDFYRSIRLLEGQRPVLPARRLVNVRRRYGGNGGEGSLQPRRNAPGGTRDEKGQQEETINVRRCFTGQVIGSVHHRTMGAPVTGAAHPGLHDRPRPPAAGGIEGHAGTGGAVARQGNWRLSRSRNRLTPPQATVRLPDCPGIMAFAARAIPQNRFQDNSLRGITSEQFLLDNGVLEHCHGRNEHDDHRRRNADSGSR